MKQRTEPVSADLLTSIYKGERKTADRAEKEGIMKAYVLRDVGKFGLEELEKPSPGEKEVIVSVKAAGICGSDIPRVYTTGTYSFPMVPGHEFSGVVSEVGAGVDSALIGKRVGIFPLIPCGECRFCQEKIYECCKKYNYLGSRTDGGYAEYVKVPVWNLIELPDRVSFEQAAMLEPMAVAVHAMRRVGIENDVDKTVAICGLGTIGLLLTMFLLESGVKNILLIGNKAFQKETVLRLGVEEKNYCDVKTENVDQWLDLRTDTQGVDVFFDCVGKNEVVSLAVKHTIPNGKVMLVGNPASDMTLDKQTYWKILRNELTLFGTWNSSFVKSDTDDWHYVLKRLQEGKVHPEKLITHRFAFVDLMEGFLIMRDKTEDYVKIMGEF